MYPFKVPVLSLKDDLHLGYHLDDSGLNQAARPLHLHCYNTAISGTWFDEFEPPSLLEGLQNDLPSPIARSLYPTLEVMHE